MESNEFYLNLELFKKNCFDPQKDHQKVIADSSGNYILCLKKNSKLPIISFTPILTIFEELEVVYTGVTKISLRKRDYKQHFTGNNAGASTLRKSLGVLFGYEQIMRDKSPNNDKTKFSKEDEQKLSEWMYNNLVIFFLPNTNFDQVEIELINHFNPPLNLKSNKNLINSDFRQLLSKLRTQKK